MSSRVHATCRMNCLRRMTGRRLLIALCAAALYAAVLVGVGFRRAASRARDARDRPGPDPHGRRRRRRHGLSAQLPPLPRPSRRSRTSARSRRRRRSRRRSFRRSRCPTVPQLADAHPPGRRPGHGGGGGGNNGGAPQPPANPATGGGQTPTAGSGKGNAEAAAANTESPAARSKARSARRASARQARRRRGRHADGTPTLEQPDLLARAARAPPPIGVPNFFIDKFRIPPFLLPIYQAAGIQYGVRWEVLAAINEIETDYGRNLNVSSAGAVGWMQFMPLDVEALRRRRQRRRQKDPYNPVDAIFAAARYLRAAGADSDLRARDLRLQPRRLVRRLRPPARARDRRPARQPRRLAHRPHPGPLPGRRQGHATPTTSPSATASACKAQGERRRRRRVRAEPPRIKIFAKQGAPVIAVNDGRIVADRHAAKRLGRFVMLQDVYGNTLHVRAPRLGRQALPGAEAADGRQARDRQGARAAGKPTPRRPRPPRHDGAAARAAEAHDRRARPRPQAATGTQAASAARAPRRPPTKERLFANPRRPNAADAGGAQQEFERPASIDGVANFEGYFTRVFGLDRKDVRLKPLNKGSHGRRRHDPRPHRQDRARPSRRTSLFEIRPAGRGAPRIDPKPILDGWKLLESTAIYRAAGKNPFFGRTPTRPSIGQILLMSKEALAQRVLADPRIEIYDCGRRDIQTGQIDRRVLATLEFLAASGFKPTVTVAQVRPQPD